MRSIRLVVSCDRSQSQYASVQIGHDWVRVHVAYPEPIVNPADIWGQLDLAARMIVAATGWFDIAEVDDLTLMFTGPDFTPGGSIYQDTHDTWAGMITARLRGLAQAAVTSAAPPATSSSVVTNGSPSAANESPPAAPGSSAAAPSTPAAAPTSVLASVLAMINHAPRASPTPEATATETTLPASRPPGLPIPVLSTSATLAASVPYRTDGTSETYAQRVASSIAQPEKRGVQDSTQRERRVKIIQEMVRTVQQYVRTYGAAPDFGSDKPAIITKVHNYIRSVTTRQQASAEVLDAVRAQLAAAGTV